LAVTIKDIAKKAGVSTATVSRVLNDSALISDETKKIVRRIMKELGYSRFTKAENMVKRSMKTVGLLVPDIRNIFLPLLVKAVEDEMDKNSYNIFLCHTDGNIAKEKRYLDTLLEKGVDGIILIGTRPAKLNHKYISNLSEKIPVMIINDYIIGSNVYSVMADEVEGSYKAITHLISLGHKKIAFINGDVDYTTYRYKNRGYEKALNDNDIEINPDYIIKEAPYEDGGYRGAEKLMDLPDRPTAIFTASDQIAIGAIRAVYKKGYKIPDDVSLVGISGLPLSAELYPSLTTVDVFPHIAGKTAASILLKLIKGEKLTQKKILIEPKLVIRESVRSIIEDPE